MNAKRKLYLQLPAGIAPLLGQIAAEFVQRDTISIGGRAEEQIRGARILFTCWSEDLSHMACIELTGANGARWTNECNFDAKRYGPREVPGWASDRRRMGAASGRAGDVQRWRQRCQGVGRQPVVILTSEA